MHDPTKVAFGLLRTLFDAMVAAADPLRVVPPALPRRPRGMVTVLGAGKAAAAMARAAERTWGPPMRGLVIVPDGYALPCRYVEVVEAAHPVPDARGERAARRLLTIAKSLGEDDFLLALISGGGSALLSLPAAGISLAEKRAVTEALLRCGASIHEINAVRRHLSAVKGGRLAAAAWPARVLTLLISDVTGNDPAVIASGPTIPATDGEDAAAALAILERWRIATPAAVRTCLASRSAAAKQRKENALSSPRGEWRLVATPERALAEAVARARRAGLRVMNLGASVEGEARIVGRRHARLAGMFAAGAGRRCSPAVILSGGELTVHVHGTDGIGGPNGEYALSLALTLQARHGHGPCPPPPIHALAADTDGRDGTGDNAGACVDPHLLARARRAGVDPRRSLAVNDSFRVFAAAGALLRTGPTYTNVNDFRAVLVGIPARPLIDATSTGPC